MKLRVGRKVRRNLYIQIGPQPDDRDLPVGAMTDEHVARLVVEAWNAAYDEPPASTLLVSTASS